MSKNKVRLYAPPGTDEANHSVSFGQPYRVDNDGTVLVDEEAVEGLVDKGGFVLAEPPAPVEVAHGHIRVRHVSDGDAMCSHAGIEFAKEDDGSLIVPVEAVAHLLPHGFRPVEEAAPAADEPPTDQPTPEAEAAKPVEHESEASPIAP